MEQEELSQNTHDVEERSDWKIKPVQEQLDAAALKRREQLANVKIRDERKRNSS